MTTPATSYDAIIIGGRCAGASLALRLAHQNRRVLLVDRATFPSLPNVPSSPIIHAGTMRLMDELGIGESAYTYPDGIAHAYVMDVVNRYSVVLPTAQMNLDRNYVYGIDRTRFDTVLWEHAATHPNITALQGFSVTRLVRDEAERVRGIVGHGKDGESEVFVAPVVVGADGRFSWTAREVGAHVTEEHNQQICSSYHAEWENVDPYRADLPHTVTIYNTMQGFVVLFIPINTRKYIVGTYLRADQSHFGAQQVEEAYLEGLKSIPAAWQRLQNAEQVTKVVGVRGIQNGYRQAYGAGWALVGDAVHYKDPLDGQGIYDALLGAKLLAEAIETWAADEPWEAVGQRYEAALLAATHEMFIQTVGRIKQEMYSTPPALVINTLIRWTLSDPDYQAGFLRYINRAIEPSQRPTPSLGLIWRGIRRDLRRGKGQARVALAQTPA